LWLFLESGLGIGAFNMRYGGCPKTSKERTMIRRKPVYAAVAVLAAVYLAYPYVTLYRLGQAIRAGDAGSLRVMVDWPRVREGIKEDISDLVLDEQPQTGPSDKLPPFGASFARGVAASSVDQQVTPEALAAVARPRTGAAQGAPVHVNWAFFESPGRFAASFNTPMHKSIRVEMELRGASWQVTRVWLPPRLLASAEPRA
jgi:hypothetical protein